MRGQINFAPPCSGSPLEQSPRDGYAQPATATQVGGTHYRDMAIQPCDFILQNNIGWAEGTAIAYIARWRQKGGVQDLKKAIHTLQLLIESEG